MQSGKSLRDERVALSSISSHPLKDRPDRPCRNKTRLGSDLIEGMDGNVHFIYNNGRDGNCRVGTSFYRCCEMLVSLTVEMDISFPQHTRHIVHIYFDNTHTMYLFRGERPSSPFPYGSIEGLHVHDTDSDTAHSPKTL